MSLFSVNTNLGALAALQSLESTQQALNETQNEVSTGQKVSAASDNPAIYSIANTINANVAGLSAVSDSLNFGAQVVAAASSAVTSISSVLDSLQQTVTSSITSGESLATLQNNVSNALTSINQYASDATFSGVNLLVKNNTGDVTSNSLNVVQSVDGGVYSVANQLNPTTSTTNNTLTDALGLTGLNVSQGDATTTSIAAYSNIGANISFDNNAIVGTAAVGGTFQTGVANTNAAIQITVGATGGTDTKTTTTGNTITFEFNDLANPAPLQSYDTSSTTAGQTNTNTVIAVNFNSSTDSTNDVVAKLATALNANGFGVVQQPDGSLNIVGQGITQVAYGQVSANAFIDTAGGGSSGTGSSTAGALDSTDTTTTDDTLFTTGTSSTGVTVSALTPNATAVTTVQSAVAKLNTISATLGAATQQITGIQNFTSALSSALTAGVGALTDADLATESAKLTSLQTKQQLATQSLSIAEQQPQSLLTLFKNA
jgi:flagellin